MANTEQIHKICVIGAGSSGLGAAKNLLQHGFDVEILESQSDVGGNWNIDLPRSRVCQSTRMITSRGLTQYPDYPMPDTWPEYPHHSQVNEYLHDYTDHFNLRPHIQFNKEINTIVLDQATNTWQVTVNESETRAYSHLLIANGHNWVPNQPTYEGNFAGEQMHAAEYKTHHCLEGNRVLVVGAGNTGCDIAVEAVNHAKSAAISLRRGYHFIPKFMFGRPADKLCQKMAKVRFPTWMRYAVAGLMVRFVMGPIEKYGLPKPKHRIFFTHPIVNSLLPYYVRHGAVAARPDIARFDDHTVHFSDGTHDDFDLIIYATGYRIEFPFLDKSLLNWRDGCPRLHLNIFHPTMNNLFAVGLIQPGTGGQFALIHWQTLAIAKYLKALGDGNPKAQAARRLIAKLHGRDGQAGDYDQSARHLLEVEYWTHIRQLKKIIRTLPAD